MVCFDEFQSRRALKEDVAGGQAISGRKCREINGSRSRVRATLKSLIDDARSGVFWEIISISKSKRARLHRTQENFSILNLDLLQ